MPRSYRKRARDSDSDEGSDKSDEEDTVRQKLNETKELQKFRQRSSGISAARLAFGDVVNKNSSLDVADPFKLKTGGLVDMTDVNKRDTAEEEAIRLDNTFAAETNIRDDDEAMMKYIDEQMAKKAEEVNASAKLSEYEQREKELYTIPQHLNVSSAKRSEDMLSSQMLSGIPEVDLGVEEKIRNIEATEKAKQDHIATAHLRRKKTSSMVPANLAVNFSMHHRYYREDRRERREKSVKEQSKAVAPEPVVGGPLAEPHPDVASAHALKQQQQQRDQQRKKEGLPRHAQASDDYHYEKFKKRTRYY